MYSWKWKIKYLPSESSCTAKILPNTALPKIGEKLYLKKQLNIMVRDKIMALDTVKVCKETDRPFLDLKDNNMIVVGCL